MQVSVYGAMEFEPAIFAIGLDPVGRCVTRDNKGRWATRTLRIIGDYSELEIIETECRPNPVRKAAPAARLVLGLALVVVTAPTVRELALITLVALGAEVLLRFREWARAEIIEQWRFGLALVLPISAVYAWLHHWGL
jgi:hypothetical protein